ncbi:MAG: phosphoribosyltransferase family protein [Acidobacteriaceae bacterium]
MIFNDREDAGRRLAHALYEYANRKDVTVLGIPRGGVTVAFEVAEALHVPLDIFLSRKLGVPGQEELAFGAIAAGNGRYLDQQVIQAAGISEQQVERITDQVKEVLHERASLYRGNRPPLRVHGRVVILVDDGVATGASIFAAINALHQMKPAKLIVAVPVAPTSTCAWLRKLVDQFVCLDEEVQFHAVGQFYRNFSQVSDEEVMALLRRAEHLPSPAHSTVHPTQDEVHHEVSIHIGNVWLDGTLSLPKGAKGIVVFAHGSGSSRHSPRNLHVAEVLQSRRIATLLFDLLTPQEEAVDQHTAELRFDISLLSARLVGATKWIEQSTATSHLLIGYFGASTGAAAALVAAAQLKDKIAAVVSRGGRPDLAAHALEKVKASVLLIVGGRDETVLTMNRQALARLQCQNKQLVVIPGATHLFEEAGKLEQVAGIAADWFAHHLLPERLHQREVAPLGSSGIH